MREFELDEIETVSSMAQNGDVPISWLSLRVGKTGTLIHPSASSRL